jgi:hypothetical protein
MRLHQRGQADTGVAVDVQDADVDHCCLHPRRLNEYLCTFTRNMQED